MCGKEAMRTQTPTGSAPKKYVPPIPLGGHNKCLNSNTASNMTAKVAKPIKNGRKQGRLCMIEFHFFGMPIKTLGSLGKIRVGRVTGNTHMSRVMRKPMFCICENKDTDQLCGNRKADQRLCFRYLDRTIPLLPKYKISSL